MTESKFFHITKNGKLTHLKNSKEAISKLGENGFVWFLFCNPETFEIEEISDKLGLHTLSIEDCFDDEQIPKMDEFQKNTYILFNSFTYKEKELAVDEINLFLGENFILTVDRIGLFNPLIINEFEQKVILSPEEIKSEPSFLMHIILDYIVDRKFVAIEAIEEELDNVEDKMLENPSDFNLAEIQILRKNILSMRKSLFHERELLIKVNRKDSKFIPDKLILYYRDIYDHITKFFELTETHRDIVTSLTDMHLSILNNLMARSANKTNITMRRLTLITTIFMPLTLLSGIGGMSEWSMITGPENWKISYPMFFLGMLMIGVLNFFFLKWLDRRSSKDI
jgi:magnesium transporter